MNSVCIHFVLMNHIPHTQPSKFFSQICNIDNITKPNSDVNSIMITFALSIIPPSINMLYEWIRSSCEYEQYLMGSLKHQWPYCQNFEQKYDLHKKHTLSIYHQLINTIWHLSTNVLKTTYKYLPGYRKEIAL